ncbi:hypothetical protein [Mucilaginibacter rubeus]|uniref:hypothetical protein n=1 Tax=Mucilaginibacter rubeus TaxID=2027860 RepID=UPI0021D2C63B|nr:hypothetical protein [Mucilaginibacter rubeus]
MAVDPMAEATESMSVYQYANNNPIMMNDPEGNYAQSLYYSFMSNPQAAVASPFSDPNFNARMRAAFKLRYVVRTFRNCKFLYFCLYHDSGSNNKVNLKVEV